jgi:hypothetical protein
MTSPENVGQQFVHLYRGLHGVSDLSKVNFKFLGHHWTEDPSVAKDFATNNLSSYDLYPDIDGEPGFLISAKVHRDNIIDPHSEEGDWWHMETGVLPPSESEEAEHTVREGSPVHIVSVRKLSPKFEEDKDGELALTHVDVEDHTDFPSKGSSSRPRLDEKTTAERVAKKGRFYTKAFK